MLQHQSHVQNNVAATAQVQAQNTQPIQNQGQQQQQNLGVSQVQQQAPQVHMTPTAQVY